MNTQSIYNVLDYTTKEINRNCIFAVTTSRGRCCSKSCAAQFREKKKPGYNPERVARNNIRRECWTDCPESENERYPLSYDGADFDQWGDCEFGIHD